MDNTNDIPVRLWQEISQASNERISKEIHPQHTRSSLERLRDNIHVYPNGNCVVHHMFGSSVVQTVQDHYQDAFVTVSILFL